MEDVNEEEDVDETKDAEVEETGPTEAGNPVQRTEAQKKVGEINGKFGVLAKGKVHTIEKDLVKIGSPEYQFLQDGCTVIKRRKIFDLKKGIKNGHHVCQAFQTLSPKKKIVLYEEMLGKMASVKVKKSNFYTNWERKNDQKSLEQRRLLKNEYYGSFN